MEIKVTKITPFNGKGGLLGFASVALVVGENQISLNSISIRESNKDGNIKIYCSPAQQLSTKDNKYYDIFNIQGQLWWDINNAIIAAYKGENSSKATATETPQQPTQQTTLANKKMNPFTAKK